LRQHRAQTIGLESGHGSAHKQRERDVLAFGTIGSMGTGKRAKLSELRYGFRIHSELWVQSTLVMDIVCELVMSI
jgi:hypothetical protein